MIRIRAILIATVLALVPAAEATAQSRGRSPEREPPARRERQVEAPRADLGAVVRRVGAGREGRMLGVSPRGETVVVRWEYPGGRVADIRVDARTGRVLGEN